MPQSSVLLVMHARRIAGCISAIRKLPIDQAWMAGYTERELEEIVPQVIADHPADRYLILSDDVVPSDGALQAVLDVHDQVGGVVTGWCCYADNDPRANLSLVPLRKGISFPPASPLAEDVRWHPEPTLRTSFAGFVLTCMGAMWWERYPFQALGVGGGGAADYSLSWRLQEDAYPITAVRDAYCTHVRLWAGCADPRPECAVLIGQMEQEVLWFPYTRQEAEA